MIYALRCARDEPPQLFGQLRSSDMLEDVGGSSRSFSTVCNLLVAGLGSEGLECPRGHI